MVPIPLRSRRIDRSGVVAVAVEREYALGGRIVDDAVSVSRSIYLAYHFQCLQIEYDRLALRAIADESASQARTTATP